MSTNVDYNFSHDEETGRFNYIDIDPERLWEVSASINRYLDQITNGLTSTTNLFEGLMIPWAGPDSDAAQALYNRLKADLLGLFGTGDEESMDDFSPSQGALLKISAGLQFVARNFGLTENEVKSMAKDFTDSLNNPPPATPLSLAGDRDWEEGPVIELNRRWGITTEWQ